MQKEDTKLDKIIFLLEGLKSSVTDIESRLEKIESILDIVNESAQNMDGHIAFVETAMDVVKHPVKTLLHMYYRNDEEEINRIDNLMETKRRGTLLIEGMVEEEVI